MSFKKREIFSISRRFIRNISVKRERVDVGKLVLEKFILVLNEEFVLVMSFKKKFIKRIEN